jgi:hypothetical protein
MRRQQWARRGVVVAATAVAAGVTTVRAQAQARHQDTVRVLLLGNSCIYYNNLPRLLEGIAASRPGRPIRTTMIAGVESTLRDHWQDTATRSLLRHGRWDWVVLNEQSTFEETFFVDGRPRVHGWAAFAQYADRLTRAARLRGSRVALLSHWADRDAPARDQAALDYAITEVARAVGATVVPVGSAWQAVRRMRPDIMLYEADGRHPASAGSYLAAAVLYATITGASPVGAGDTVLGPAIALADGRVMPDSTVVLAALPAADGDILRRAAWAEHRALASRGGLPAVHFPAPLGLPRLPPAGARPTRAQLAGIWRGESTLYPTNGPAPTQLWIGARGDGMWGRIRVVLGPLPEQVHEGPLSVTITDHGVVLTDPDGPDHGSVRYRGVVHGDLLRGVADFVESDPLVRGIGTWVVHKDH